jgi:phage shock protein PspC (stress-responsive transcriptional regulator)
MIFLLSLLGGLLTYFDIHMTVVTVLVLYFDVHMTVVTVLVLYFNTYWYTCC